MPWNPSSGGSGTSGAAGGFSAGYYSPSAHDPFVPDRPPPYTPYSQPQTSDQQYQALRTGVGKAPINPIDFISSAEESIRNAGQVGEGLAGAAARGAGGFIGGAIGQSEAGASVGGAIGGAIGGVIGGIGSVLSSIPALPTLPGYRAPLVNTDELKKTDPALYNQLKANIWNPFQVYDLMNKASDELEAKQVAGMNLPSWLTPALTRSNTLAGQLGQDFAALGVPQQMVARGIAGGVGRAAQFKNLPRDKVAENLLPLWEEARAGKVSDDKINDELVHAGEAFFDTGGGNTAGAIGNTLLSVFTDPLIVGSFGTGVVARTATRIVGEGGLELLRNLGTEEGAALTRRIAERLPDEFAAAQRAKDVPALIMREAANEGVSEDLIKAAQQTVIDAGDAGTRPVISGVMKSLRTAGREQAFLHENGLTRVHEAVAAINDNISMIGMRGRAPLANAHLSVSTTRGAAAAFGYGYHEVQKVFADAGLGDEFAQMFGTAAANTGYAVVGDDMARDVITGQMITDARPMAVAQNSLEKGVYGEDLRKRVEQKLRETAMAPFQSVGKGTEADLLRQAREVAYTELHTMARGRIDDAVLREAAQKMSPEALAAVHYTLSGRQAQRINTAKNTVLAKIIGAGPKQDAERALVARVTRIGRRELTVQRAATLVEEIADDPTAAQRALRRYDALAENFIDTGDAEKLAKQVTQFIEDHGDSLTSEWSDIPKTKPYDALREYARQGEPVGEGLGLRPRDGTPEWSLKFNPEKPSEIISAHPWMDVVSEAAAPLDSYPERFGAARTRMSYVKDSIFRGISQHRINFEAHQRFVSALVEGRDTQHAANITRAQASDLFFALNKKARSLETQVRGLSGDQMVEAAREVPGVGAMVAAGTLSKKDITTNVLLAMQGDIGTVGATQRLTGALKVGFNRLPGLGSNNQVGQITERAYPTVRFHWSPYFQTQELIEPHVTAAMRGIKVGVASSEMDMATGRLMNKWVATSPYAQSDMFEQSLQMLVGHDAAKKAMGDAGAREMTSKIEDIIKPGNTKVRAQARVGRMFLGEEFKRRADLINPDIIPMLMAHYGTQDLGDVAVRYMTEADTLRELGGAMHEIAADAARGAHMGSAAVGVSHDALAKVVLGANRATADDLISQVKSGMISREVYAAELAGKTGASDDYIEKTWLGLHLDPDKWWEDAATVAASSGRATKESVYATRSIMQGLADAAGISEREWLVRSNISGVYSIGSDDFAHYSMAELDAMDILRQTIHDDTPAGEIARTLWQEGKMTLQGEVGSNEWLRRAHLVDGEGLPTSPEAASIVARLGPEASAMRPLEEVQLGNRTAWLPGGRDLMLDPTAEVTPWEANIIRSQMINPKDITDENLKLGIYNAMWNAHKIDLQSADTVNHLVNNIQFAMFSPSMNLTKNEMIATRLRVRGMGTVGDKSMDTVHGVAAHHDDIVATIGAHQANVSPSDIGFAYGTRTGNYVPAADAERLASADGHFTEKGAKQVLTNAAVAKGYVEKGHRATHDLRNGPISQWVADEVERAAKDPATWRETINKRLPWAKVPELAEGQTELTAKELQSLVDDLRTEVGSLSGAGKEAANLSAAERTAALSTDEAQQAVALAETDAREKAVAAGKTPKSVDMAGKAAKEKAQAEIVAEAGLEAEPKMGAAHKALVKVVPGLAGQDENIVMTSWNYNKASDGWKPRGNAHAYVKNTDVKWRNVSTNKAIGNVVKLMKQVSEDPEYYRQREGAQFVPGMQAALDRVAGAKEISQDIVGWNDQIEEGFRQQGLMHKPEYAGQVVTNGKPPGFLYAYDDQGNLVGHMVYTAEPGAYGVLNVMSKTPGQGVASRMYDAAYAAKGEDFLKAIGQTGMSPQGKGFASAWLRKQTAAEPLDQMAERILNTTNGLAMKTGYFALDLSDVKGFPRGIMDTQMVGVLTIDMYEKTGGKGPVWDEFLKGLSGPRRTKTENWVAKYEKGEIKANGERWGKEAGDFSWGDAAPAKSAALKVKPDQIDAILSKSPTDLRAWVTDRLASQVKRSAATAKAKGVAPTFMQEDMDRVLATFSSDADLRKIVGKDLTFYGSDYKAFDGLLEKHMQAAKDAATPEVRAHLDGVGRGAYQWYLWDEYRNVFDPELSVMRQSHNIDRAGLRTLAISDDVHGAAGYMAKGGLENIAQRGYSYMDPLVTLLAQAAPDGGVRGVTITTMADRMIALSEKADVTTTLHEMVHAAIEPTMHPSGKQVVIEDINRLRAQQRVELAAERTQTALDHAEAQRVRSGADIAAAKAGDAHRAAREAEVTAAAEHRSAVTTLDKAKTNLIKAKTLSAQMDKERDAALRSAKVAREDTKALRERSGVAMAKRWLKDPSTVKPGAEIKLTTGVMLSDADVAEVAYRIGPLAEKQADGTFILKVPKKYTLAADVTSRTNSAINRSRTALFAMSDAEKAVREAGYAVENKARALETATAKREPLEAASKQAIKDAAAAAKAETTARGAMIAATKKTVGEDKVIWDREVSEHFVTEFQKWVATGKAPDPKMRAAFEYFRKVLLEVYKAAKGKPGAKVSPEMESLFKSLFSKDADQAQRFVVPYDHTQEMLHRAGVMAATAADDEAHTHVFFRNERSWLERSLNHQFFGYYPASYMWGKVLPEMIRFLAAEPFGVPAPMAGFLAAQRAWNSVEVQKDTDPQFRQMLADNEAFFRGIGMLLPATPYEFPVNAPLAARRFAQWNLTSQQQEAQGIPTKPFPLEKLIQDTASYSFGPLNSINRASEAIGGGGMVLGGLGDRLRGGPPDDQNAWYGPVMGNMPTVPVGPSGIPVVPMDPSAGSVPVEAPEPQP